MASVAPHINMETRRFASSVTQALLTKLAAAYQESKDGFELFYEYYDHSRIDLDEVESLLRGIFMVGGGATSLDLIPNVVEDERGGFKVVVKLAPRD